MVDIANKLLNVTIHAIVTYTNYMYLEMKQLI